MAAKIVRQKEYIFDLPKIEDSRGNLSFLEHGKQIPFKISRVYWIYDVPSGQKRGSHAFKTQDEIIIAASGSFDVILNDGSKSKRYQMNRAYKALYVPRGTWRYIENFATNSVCLVLSSGSYDENEYIRNYRQYKKFLKSADDYSTPGFDTDKNKVLNAEAKNELLYYSINDCALIDLPVIKNRAGNLTSVHNSIEIPFDIKRVFFVYDIPFGKTRGMHAHKHCHEFLLSISGSFDVELEDGADKQTVTLNRPMQGIHILPGIWTKETNYSSGAVCLALTSEIYTEEDYIRKYSDFKSLYGNKNRKI